MMKIVALLVCILGLLIYALGDSSKLVEVFQGKKSLSLADTIQAVLAAGYKTTSKNFATIVGNTMAKDKRFRRVRKGVYALKG